jgi:hypothetical protein
LVYGSYGHIMRLDDAAVLVDEAGPGFVPPQGKGTRLKVQGIKFSLLK